MANVEEKILRYKKYLDRYQDDKSRKKEVYQILRKLDNLPVTLDHLQSTGIGKAVNSYRKHDGDIGDEAKAIVAKWKRLVPGIRTEQPSPSIHCETISETSYHSSDAQHEHQAPLPSTLRVPYLESVKTSVVTDANSTSIGSTNCDTDDETCPKIVNNGSKCENIKGERANTSSPDQGPDDLGQEREHRKDKVKDKKHRHKDKEHSSGSHKHSKQSRHSSKEGSKKSKDDSCTELNAKHHLDGSHKEHSLQENESSLQSSKHISQENKGSSADDCDSLHHKSDSPQDGKLDHKSSSHKESKLGYKHSPHKETGSGGHENGSHRDPSSKEHKSSGHKKHRSKDSSHSREKSSKNKSSEGKLQSDTTDQSTKQSCNKESTCDGDECADGQQSSSLPSDKKLGAFKEKLSRFSDSLKKVGGLLVEGSTSGLDSKESGSHRSPLLADKLNDELLNDVLLNDSDFSDVPGKSDAEGRTTTNDCDGANSRKRKSDVNGSGDLATKKPKPSRKSEPRERNSDDEGLSFEDLMTIDEKLLRKQAKKPKLSPHGQQSAGSHHSSRSKQEDKSSKEKAHRHGIKPGKSHSDHHEANRTKSVSCSSQHKPSKESTTSPSSAIGQTDSKQKSSSKRKEAAFTVPQAPDKKMKLTDFDILGSLADSTPNNHMTSQPKGKELMKSMNKESSTEDDFLGKRNTRTQVYSGKRTNAPHEIPKLRDACLRVLMDNIDDIENVGNVPFEVLKPVLERCSSSQLYTIEEYNPQFVEKTGNLWEKLCRKDFRTEKPGEFESWRELYLRKHDEREVRLKRLTTNIAVSFAKKQEPVKKTKLAFVDSVAKPPRNVLRQQKKHGTAGLIPSFDPLSKTRKRPF